jgi:hypothetical protein
MRRLTLSLCLCLACGPRPGSTTADLEELLRGHELARRAHLEHRADLMTAGFADTVIQVARGEVRFGTPEQDRARFQRYFDRATFLAWDDIASPIIHVSPGGRMAWKVVRKRVRLTAPDSTGRPVEEHTVFAWIEILEKLDGRWKLVAVASTDRPGP